jgi:hypothetical protein
MACHGIRDGSRELFSIIQKSGYLHWQLWNCGNNVPQLVGNPLAIVSQQFDMRPNPTTGVITGAVYGSNQILCGNVFSTQWLTSGMAGKRLRACWNVPEIALHEPAKQSTPSQNLHEWLQSAWL